MESNSHSVLDLLTRSMKDQSGSLPSGRRTSKIHELVLKYAAEEPDTSSAVDQDSILKSCRPWNYADYLARVATFQNTCHWFAKSTCLSPLQCARWGWTCSQNEKDTLLCHCCDARLVHDTEGDTEGLLLHKRLISDHLAGCGWGSSGHGGVCECDVGFMDVPNLHSERILCADILFRALTIVEAMDSLHKFAGVSGGHTVFNTSELESVKSDIKSFQQLLTGDDFHRSKSSRAIGTLTSELFAAVTAMLCCEVFGGESSEACASQVKASKYLQPISLSRTVSSLKTLKEILTLASCGWECTTECSRNASKDQMNLSCKICRRAMKLSLCEGITSTSSSTGKPLANSLCVLAHRYFCPFVNAPMQLPLWCSEQNHAGGAIEAKEFSTLSSIQISVLAFAKAGGVSLCKPTSNVDAGLEGQLMGLCGGDTNSLKAPNMHNSDLPSPEQAYKRVRIVLDQVNL